MDSIASIVIIVIDVFFGRLFLYVSPLCPLVGPYFWKPSIILKLYYYISMHARFAKAVAQKIIVLNRMTCVLMPTHYAGIWARLTPISIVLIVLLPLGGTWFILLSPRFYAIPASGGFTVIYIRAVTWATASMFQSIYILTALGFTVICTTITFYKLVFLHVRVKTAEKSLCFTSIFISFTFLFVAGTQLWYMVCVPCRTSIYLFSAQFLAFDTFTIGTAVILIMGNGQLRDSIFSPKVDNKRVFRVSANNSFTHG
ncbi:unnamed protein product [Caenorhabditis brenneri]